MKKILGLICGVCITTSLHATVVKSYRVSGVQRMDDRAVVRMLGVKIGDDVKISDLNSGLQRLYKTGYFKDIEIDFEGNALVIDVTENPILNRITFEGNDELDDETLQAEVGFSPRQPYSPEQVQLAIDRILELYKRSGLFSAEIEPKIIERDQNRVDLVFEIDENDKTYILDIDIQGNRAFSDSDLKQVILSREERWWRLLSSFDTYDEDRIEYDKQMLRRHYLSNGFIDFKIVSSDAGLTPNRKGYAIRMIVDEGKRYKIDQIKINNPLMDVDTETLEEVVEIDAGDWYSISELDKIEDQMEKVLSNAGYAFVNVKADTDRNKEKKTIDVTFQITETPKVYVNRIDIMGNSRTLDYVIEREFRVKEQDAFSLAKINRTRQRLMGLGYFKTVDVRTQKVIGQPDKINLVTAVEEQPTGELSFALGWSTVNGALITAGITEKNFMGRGQTLSLNGQFSERRTKFALGLTDPYFMGYDLSAGVDLDYTLFRYSNDLGYDMQSFGGGFRFSWTYSERLRHMVRIRAQQQEIVNVSSSAPLDVQNESGNFVVFLLSQSLVYNNTVIDYVQQTRSGMITTLNLDHAGYGGDENFVKTELGTRLYHNFWDNEWQFGFSIEGGIISAIDDDYIRRHYRYYLGGDSLRGFDIAGIGARNKNNINYAYGGLSKINGTGQLNFPIGFPKEYQISGFIFSDYGWLGEPADIYSYMNYTGSLRVSGGIGIKWNSPMGQINVSYGKAFAYEEFDDRRPFLLSFNTVF